MSLPSELISQFVKITKDDKKTSTETTVYGTVVYDGKPYVKLDGSDLLTPISTTTNVTDGERVTVMIKDHTAIVTGNISSPAARTDEVAQVADQVSEFEIVRAHTVTTNDLQAINAIIENLTVKLASIDNLDVNTLNAVTAEIETLKAQIIEGKKLTVEEIDAITATLESIEAKFGEFTDISTEDLEALNAEITNLKVYTGDFTYISALKASIKDLDVKKLSAKDAEIKYLNVDLLNVDEAWFNKFYAVSGMIQNVVIDEATVVKELIGVTIKGDLIEANTLRVDQLVVRGSDGNYYKMNTDFSSLVCYEKTDTVVEPQYITLCEGVFTTGGEQVYLGSEGVEGYREYYCAVDEYVDDDGGTRYRYCLVRRTGIEPLEEDSINGSTIVANSITAEKLSVSELAAFGATIGGFHIVAPDGTKTGAIYSGAKATVDASAPGLYLGHDGQFSMGDMNNFVRFRQLLNEDGTGMVDPDDKPIYKLEISADSIVFGDGSKTNLDELRPLTEHVKIGTWVDETGNERPSIELAEGDSQFKQTITNVSSRIMDGDNVITEMDTDGVTTENVSVRGEIRQGEWAWVRHGKGNLGLVWKVEVTE